MDSVGSLVAACGNNMNVMYDSCCRIIESKFIKKDELYYCKQKIHGTKDRKQMIRFPIILDEESGAFILTFHMLRWKTAFSNE